MQRDVAWPLTRLLGEVQDVKRDIHQLEVCLCHCAEADSSMPGSCCCTRQAGPTLQPECLAAYHSSVPICWHV